MGYFLNATRRRLMFNMAPAFFAPRLLFKQEPCAITFELDLALMK